MDINQLNCFISVAQTLNFSEAARRNYVSQSTVSRYVSELEKMGGRVDKTDNKVFIYPSDLIGAETDATDLRAGAALIVASLGANGESSISNIGYILRGYEDIVGKLSSLGAIIKIV
jgi:UDP-N-acetylglucosamine 1-carboxyvinyltransferase